MMVVMRCYVIFVISLAIETMKSRSTGLENTKTFVRSEPVTSGPLRLAPSWLEDSVLSCAVHCQLTFSTKCRSFMYSHVTKLCTPGHDLISFCPPPNVTEGDLYLCDSCQPYPKFSDYVNGSTMVSYLYVKKSLTYANATAACNDMNSHLFVPNTSEKLRLFYNVINLNYSTWIGLDDQKVEGKFVWADTGLEIDPAFKKTIFAANQPDNAKNEDCAYHNPNFIGLNDGRCDNPIYYVCEKRDC